MNKKPFLIVKSKKIKKDKDSINIHISDNPPVATNKSTRKLFESKKESLWRWPAGGTAIILKLADANILLSLHRDSKAPSYANCDTISSGLGESTKEILYPLCVVYREGIEELLIQTPDGIICPYLEDDNFGFSLEIENIVKNNMQIILKTQNKPLHYTKLSEIPLNDEKDIFVHFQNKKTKTRALVNFDSSVKAIDLIKIKYLDLKKYYINDLCIYDGETSSKTLLNRTVNAYEITKNMKATGKIIASWKSGKIIKAQQKNKQTPILKEVLNALK